MWLSIMASGQATGEEANHSPVERRDVGWLAERRSRERPVAQSAPTLVRFRALVPGYTDSEPGELC